jgi:cyclopropane fatty-acyl-phospholipid synthase-like methyltransferase
MDNPENIKKTVDRYYTEKLSKYGATPQGVDWNSQGSQELRFQQILKVLTTNEDFSILDYGCGFGAMYDFMQKNYTNFDFWGYDISAAMIAKAKELYINETTSWLNDLKDLQAIDYVVASGIFNVKLENSEQNWKKYILETLQEMNRLSTKGFSFNVLTKYSDKEYMKDYLHYANPLELFDYCKQYFSKTVALLHDYPLYEFTITVKKGIL